MFGRVLGVLLVEISEDEIRVVCLQIVENTHADITVAAFARLQRQIAILASRKQISAIHVVVMMAFGIIGIKFRIAVMTCSGTIVRDTLDVGESDHRSLHAHNLIDPFRLCLLYTSPSPRD